MHRNNETLFDFGPLALDTEIRNGFQPFASKFSTFHAQSKAIVAAFEQAINETLHVARNSYGAFTTNSPAR